MTDVKSEEVIDEEKEEKEEDLHELTEPDGVDLEEVKDDKKEKKQTVITEEEKDKENKEKSESEKIKAEVEKLRKDKSDLKKALHEARQERKKPKDEDVALTDVEIQQIISEHKDDPVVLTNAIKYMVQQLVKGVKKDAVNEVEVKQKKDQFDTILRERYKDFDDEDSPIRQSTEKAKDVMMIKDHPFADALGAAVTVFANLPNITKYWFEEGKKAATDEKLDAARQKQIKDGKVTPAGAKSTVAISDKSELSESEMETAKRFGFDKDPKKMKIYMSQILRKGGK